MYKHVDNGRKTCGLVCTKGLFIPMSFFGFVFGVHKRLVYTLFVTSFSSTKNTVNSWFSPLKINLFSTIYTPLISITKRNKIGVII